MINKPGEKALKDQVDFLLDQLRQEAVDIHQFMQLLGMAYGDYLDFHPEERPGKYDKQQLERTLKCRGTSFNDKSGNSNIKNRPDVQ